MIGLGCRHEEAVRQAATSGRWTPALQSHAETCGACREVRTIAALLGAAPAGPPPGASAKMIWQRARHARRLRAEEMVSRIMTIGQLASGALGLVVLAYFASRAEFWPAVQGASATTAVLPWLVGAIVLTAGSMLAMFRWLARSGS